MFLHQFEKYDNYESKNIDPVLPIMYLLWFIISNTRYNYTIFYDTASQANIPKSYTNCVFVINLCQEFWNKRLTY